MSYGDLVSSGVHAALLLILSTDGRTDGNTVPRKDVMGQGFILGELTHQPYCTQLLSTNKNGADVSLLQCSVEIFVVALQKPRRNC